MKQFLLSASVGTATGVQVQPFVGDNYSLIINGLISVSSLLIVEYFKNKNKRKNRKDDEKKL